MGKKRCAGCGQFAGFAHRCPAVNAGGSRSLVDTLLGRQTPAFQTPPTANTSDPWADGPTNNLFASVEARTPEAVFEDTLVKFSAAPNYMVPSALRHAARSLASTPSGQKKVLEAALQASQSGRYHLADVLLESTEEGNADAVKQDPSASEWNIKNLAAIGEQTTYDKTDSEIDAFYKTLQTPLNVPPAGNTPGKTLPFSGVKAANHIQIIADSVARDGTDIYSPELKREAQQYRNVSLILEEPGQPGYAEGRYTQFTAKVTKAHKNHRELLNKRITKLIRYTDYADERLKKPKTGPIWDEFIEPKKEGSYYPSGWISDPL